MTSLTVNDTVNYMIYIDDDIDVCSMLSVYVLAKLVKDEVVVEIYNGDTNKSLDVTYMLNEKQISRVYARLDEQRQVRALQVTHKEWNGEE